MADIFFNALKNKYRFNYRGVLTTEDLFNLDVKDLDAIYKSLKKFQRESDEESLLQKEKKENKILNDKIAIIRTIVEDKMIQKDKAKKAAQKKAQNQKILEILADKKNEDLKSKSVEELQAMLAEDDEDED